MKRTASVVALFFFNSFSFFLPRERATVRGVHAGFTGAYQYESSRRDKLSEMRILRRSANGLSPRLMRQMAQQINHPRCDTSTAKLAVQRHNRGDEAFSFCFCF